MTIKFRRVLYIVFILAFLIITPSIIIRASGYTINLSWPIEPNKTFQKTGMFLFDTEPKGAKIYINDKPQQSFLKKYFSKQKNYITTPAKIKNLIPKEYEVKFELDGYWPWTKKLTIFSGQSTYAENVRLFKKDMPIQIAKIDKNENAEKKQILSSYDKKYAIILENAKIINLKNEQPVEFDANNLSGNAGSSTPSWSYDNKKILINNIIFDLNDSSKKIILDDLIGHEIKNIKWDENNSNKIYYDYKNSISSLDLNSKISETITNGDNYHDYSIKDNVLFYISQINKTTKLKSIFLDNKKIVSEIELPYSSEYKILNYQNNFLGIYDDKHKILYLIDPFSKSNPLKEILNNVKDIRWINDNEFLYFNDFEIWIVNIGENSSKTLLTRISQKIIETVGHSSNNYILYSTENSINIIELDKREKRNLTELIKLEKIYSPFLNEKGDVLYFGAKIGSQEGLYKLAL